MSDKILQELKKSNPIPETINYTSVDSTNIELMPFVELLERNNAIADGIDVELDAIVNNNKTITLDTEIPVVMYTVTFDAAGGVPQPEPQLVAAGGTVEQPDSPTRVDEVFDAWQLDGVDYDFSTPVNADIILFAMYIEA